MQREDIVLEYSKQTMSGKTVYSLYMKGQPRYSSYMDYDGEQDFISQMQGWCYAAEVLGFHVVEIVEVV